MSLKSADRPPPSVQLRPLADDDVAKIHDWPSYTGEFAPLDYALRRGGWLDAFPESPTTRRFGLWAAERLIGFSLLTNIVAGRAEFYIAIHPEETGRGFGLVATRQVLEFAFNELRLTVVYLKVRTWHERGIALYRRLGFVTTGEKSEEIQGTPERFFVMEIAPALARAKTPL